VPAGAPARGVTAGAGEVHGTREVRDEGGGPGATAAVGLSTRIGLDRAAAVTSAKERR